MPSDARGKLSQASKEVSRVLEIPQQATSTSAPIMILPVQKKLANLADVPSAVSFPFEEQYTNVRTHSVLTRCQLAIKSHES